MASIETARRLAAEAQERLQNSNDLIRRSDWRVAPTDFGVISEGEFLDYFAIVESSESVCGVALSRTVV